MTCCSWMFGAVFNQIGEKKNRKLFKGNHARPSCQLDQFFCSAGYSFAFNDMCVLIVNGWRVRVHIPNDFSLCHVASLQTFSDKITGEAYGPLIMDCEKEVVF